SEDGSETFTSTMVVDVIGEVADDTATMQPGETSVTVDVLANDTVDGVVLDPTSVRLVDPGTGAPVPSLTTPEGSWSVDTTTGAVTFTPVPNYVGEVPAVSYVVTGDDGATYTAEVSVEVLGAAADDTALLFPGEDDVVIDVLDNDVFPGTTVPLLGSVRLVDPADGEEKQSVTVAGVGTWTVSLITGRVTFEPASGFTGLTPPLAYLVDGDDGGTYTADVTVDVLGEAADDTATIQPGESGATVDVLGNDASATGTTLDPSTVELIDPADGTAKSSVTTDEGTWTVETTGQITFTPAAGYVGTTPPMTYLVTGADGVTYTAEVSVEVLGAAAPDTVTLSPGESSVTFHPGDNDTPDGVELDPTSVRLVDPDTGDPVEEVTIPGVGTWSVDTDTGEVTFTPEDGFTGKTPPMSYVIDSEDGTQTYTSTMTVDVIGAATDDSAVLRPGSDSVAVDVLANDDVPSPVASSVRLVDPSDGQAKTSVTTDEGTWTVDETTGVVTFVPAEGFTGKTTPLAYVVTGGDGATYTAEVSVEVVGAATPDQVLTTPGGPAVFDPLANDRIPGETLDPTTVRLIDPATGDPVTSLSTPEGEWTVDTSTGVITFTPAPGYVGTPPPVSYVVTSESGRTYTADVTVTAVGLVTPDEETAEGGSPVVIDPLANDQIPGVTLDPSSVRLIDPETGLPVTELVVDGVGTWTVDTTTGLITFTPEDGFTGAVPPVTYIVVGDDGLTYGATIELTIEPAATETTDDPDDSDDPDGGLPGLLPGTGSPISPAMLTAALLLLGTGAVLVRRARRHS
ncbi:MAG: hypothetical protein QM621_03775, partial [Aeromicrobium sp.]|uniref:Ig-like domain-containing protein n=1 Tax=Aeromicrobium sp. TaxID=1871063 RepID=UPI0039E41EB0